LRQKAGIDTTFTAAITHFQLNFDALSAEVRLVVPSMSLEIA
jgi:hypothetical protein